MFNYCIDPNFNHQTPITSFKLVTKCDTKVVKANKPLLLKRGENEIAKYDPKVNVIVIYPSQSIKSQCIYLYPLPRTSYEPYLFTTQPSKHLPPIICQILESPQTVIKITLFLFGLTYMATIKIDSISPYHTQYTMIGHSRFHSLDL